MKQDLISFTQRTQRTHYIYENFSDYLGKKILDVGCDQAILKTLLSREHDYTGIDVGGTPDITLNLDQVDRLPFDDNLFDTVICADVLEHLDNLHLIFAELIRVCRGYVIIAWPNNWVNARVPIARGKGSFAHYGLPEEKPADRHKWFFSFTEARTFVFAHSGKSGLFEIAEDRICLKPKLGVIRLIRQMLYPNRDRYYNRYAHTYWTVLKKRT